MHHQVAHPHWIAAAVQPWGLPQQLAPSQNMLALAAMAPNAMAPANPGAAPIAFIGLHPHHPHHPHPHHPHHPHHHPHHLNAMPAQPLQPSPPPQHPNHMAGHHSATTAAAAALALLNQLHHHHHQQQQQQQHDLAHLLLQQQQHQQHQQLQHQQQLTPLPQLQVRVRNYENFVVGSQENGMSYREILTDEEPITNKRKYLADDRSDSGKDLKKAKLETKALKAKRPGFTDERYNETSYYIENGLRKVYPYYFTFTTFTKGRWVNQNILDVFAREFRAHPAEEYERCIKSGSLTVNYQKVDTQYKLKHNDLLANVVHRHEVPVTNDPITIVHMDDDIVVVNKPASIPVHPCGRYRHNTVVFVLAKEHNLRNLRTIHRLDRLTSGLLMFGRTPRYARIMEAQIRNRQVNKQYVCRVEGRFPEQTIECNHPIEVVSYKIGVCKVSNKGKNCSTTFQLVGYNEKTNISVVLCFPHSGRMHQIRVHLQYLGFPVKNDPLYNHVVFGPEKGRGGVIGKSDEQLIHDLINIHNAENWLGMDGDSELMPILKDVDVVDEGKKTPPGFKKNESAVELQHQLQIKSRQANQLQLQYDNAMNVSTQTGQDVPDMDFDAEKLTHDPHCYECRVKFRDPKPKDLIMYLHAWKYSGPGWSYETDLPVWANVEWKEPE